MRQPLKTTKTATPAKPVKKRPVRTNVVRKGPLRVRWLGLRTMYDFWGKEIPRHYQVETLSSSIEGMVLGNDRFIVPSIQQMLGPAPLTNIVFELFQEGQYQLIFRVRATNVKRKMGVFGLVAAKKEGSISTLAEAEHLNLRILYRRDQDFIVRPFLGGTVFLPDRYHRKEKDRTVYAYMTQWLGTYHELGVDRNLQFFVNVRQPQSFSKAQTDLLKGRMLEVIAKSYDPERRECMEMPQVASGDFVVTKPSQTASPRIKLIACRRLLRNVSPARLLHIFISTEWVWGGRSLSLAPEDPRLILEALGRARGKAEARAWLAEYRAALRGKRYREHPALPVEVINELLGD